MRTLVLATKGLSEGFARGCRVALALGRRIALVTLALAAMGASVLVPIAAVLVPIDYLVNHRVPFTRECLDGYEERFYTRYFSPVTGKWTGLAGNIEVSECVQAKDRS